MAKQLGKDHCLCRNGATFGAAKYIPLIAARDLKVAAKPAGVFESTDRATQIQTVIPVRRSLEISFSALWNAGAGLLALRNAFTAGSAIELAYINAAPGTGGKGFHGDFYVVKFGMKFPLTGGQMIDVTVKPHANYTNRVRIFTDANDGSTLGTPEVQANKKIGYAATVNDSTHTAIPTAREISWSLEWAEEEASDRAQEGDGFGVAFQQYLPCMPKVSAETEVIWNESVHGAFRTAFDNNSSMELFFLDGPYASGAWGVHSDWSITDFPIDAPLIDGAKVKLKFEPTNTGSNPFAFYSVP